MSKKDVTMKYYDFNSLNVVDKTGEIIGDAITYLKQLSTDGLKLQTIRMKLEFTPKDTNSDHDTKLLNKSDEKKYEIVGIEGIKNTQAYWELVRFIENEYKRGNIPSDQNSWFIIKITAHMIDVFSAATISTFFKYVGSSIDEQMEAINHAFQAMEINYHIVKIPFVNDQYKLEMTVDE